MSARAKQQQTSLSNLIGMYMLIGLLSAALIGFFVLKPLYSSASRAHQDRVAADAKLKQLKQLQKDTQALLANYEQVKDRRDEALHLLPPKTQEENLLVQLSSFADASGVQLTTFTPNDAVAAAASITPGATSTANPLSTSTLTYPATINLAGTSDGIVRFLQKIEKSARYIDVTNASFGASENSSQVTARLTINAYYQNDLETASTTTLSAGAVK